MRMQTILALDSAMGGCGVAVASSGMSAPVVRKMETQREQARFLVPMVVEVLEEAGLGFEALDGIACTCGPGSFTGVRIGLATARALGLALGLPVVGVSTLDAVARTYRDAGCARDFLAVVETKRADFYARLYDASGAALSDSVAAEASSVLALTDGRPCVVGGDAVERFRTVLGDLVPEGMLFLEEISQPDPSVVAVEGLALFGQGGETDSPAVPLYLRGADVSKPKRVLRK